MYSSATVPILVSRSQNPILANVGFVISGLILISLLAQIAIPLPWTPVPITGQTFAVSLVSLSWGWKRGASVLALYLLLGGVGFPIFAMGKSGLLIGPTLGYLVGMFFASFVVGYLADKGFTKNFLSSILAAYVGSFLIFSCGVIGLSFFLPTESLFIAGVLPFLLGDTIKNFLAAYISMKIRNRL